MKTFLWLLTLATLLTVFTVSHCLAGDNACAFLRTGVGARSLGMGSTGVLSANNATVLYWNPALLADLQTINLDTTYSDKFSSGVEYGFLGFTYRNLGIGLLRQGVRDIEKSSSLDINNRPVIDGSFDNVEQALYLSYGYRLNAKVNLGATIKYLYQTLDTGRANGISLDVAGLYKIWQDDKREVRAGLNLQDANNPAFKWNTGQKDRVPVNLKVGIGYEQKIKRFYLDRALITIEENKRESRSWLTNAGIELKTSVFTTVRAGYNGENMTFGASLFYKLVYIDYAFTPHVLGDTHWFSIGGKF